jgi:hypothetical protein
VRCEGEVKRASAVVAGTDRFVSFGLTGWRVGREGVWTGWADCSFSLQEHIPATIAAPAAPAGPFQPSGS